MYAGESCGGVNSCVWRLGPRPDVPGPDESQVPGASDQGDAEIVPGRALHRPQALRGPHTSL